MKKMILITNRSKDKNLAVTRKVLTVLGCFCEKVYMEDGILSALSSAPLCVSGYRPGNLPSEAELILVLGGDGTMLHAAEDALRLDIPLLGVNLGRLGYLATVETTEIPLLSCLADDSYAVQTRMTLSLAVRKEDGSLVPLSPCALNDAVIDGGGHLADIRLHTENAALDYRADGLILATPTGSTAYSLSAGGPVIDEGMDALCVTPICPRSFFSRSLLFGGETVLEAENLGGRNEALRVTVDGAERAALLPGERLCVSRARKRLRLLSFGKRDLLDVLCTKMKMNHF